MRFLYFATLLLVGFASFSTSPVEGQGRDRVTGRFVKVPSDPDQPGNPPRRLTNNDMTDEVNAALNKRIVGGTTISSDARRAAFRKKYSEAVEIADEFKAGNAQRHGLRRTANQLQQRADLLKTRIVDANRITAVRPWSQVKFTSVKEGIDAGLPPAKFQDDMVQQRRDVAAIEELKNIALSSRSGLTKVTTVRGVAVGDPVSVTAYGGSSAKIAAIEDGIAVIQYTTTSKNNAPITTYYRPDYITTTHTLKVPLKNAESTVVLTPNMAKDYQPTADIERRVEAAGRTVVFKERDIVTKVPVSPEKFDDAAQQLAVQIQKNENERVTRQLKAFESMKEQAVADGDKMASNLREMAAQYSQAKKNANVNDAFKNQQFEGELNESSAPEFSDSEDRPISVQVSISTQ